MYDPLMVSPEEAARTRERQPAREAIPILKVVTQTEYKLNRALDGPINQTTIRGLLLGWVIDKEQSHLKGLTQERRFFLVWKKAQSLNETRMSRRLPDDKVKSIAQTVTDAFTDGTANLKYRAYYKEDILRKRDYEEYLEEQRAAGRASGESRRYKAMGKWRDVMDDVRKGRLTKTEIASKHGLHRNMVRYIIRQLTT